MVNVKAINDERFGRWKVQFNRHNSTPVLMVGVGHDHVDGRIFFLTTEDRTNEEAILFLREALRQLEETAG